jgi:hypothetical protein
VQRTKNLRRINLLLEKKSLENSLLQPHAHKS